MEARATAHLVHKTVHETFTNHNKVLANIIGNVLKEVFSEAPLDQVGPSYFNDYNRSTVGTSVPSSNQQPNGGQYQQPPAQQLPGGQAQDQTLQMAGVGSSPANGRGARSDDKGATTSIEVIECPYHIDSSAAN